MKKAELESAQAAQAQVKKEQHNKSRQNNQDGDPEAPQLDELIPDKLARPENPLEKGIEFLKPLQLLATENIETHMLAFELYYRKNKVLLMLQSIKRARAIDRDDAQLHLNLVKFSKVLQSLKNSEQNDYVKTVIEKEIVSLFDGKSAKVLNENVLKQHGDSFIHVFNVAKAMYVLDSSTKEQAVKLVVDYPMEKLTLQVMIFFVHIICTGQWPWVTCTHLNVFLLELGSIVGFEYTQGWHIRRYQRKRYWRLQIKMQPTIYTRISFSWRPSGDYNIWINNIRRVATSNANLKYFIK